jgi:hypothetical protein
LTLKNNPSKQLKGKLGDEYVSPNDDKKMNKMAKLKKERSDLESMLLAKPNSEAAHKALEALNPFFDKIDCMKSYYPLGKIRLAYLFLESDLGDVKDLFNSYGRFANLIEGIEV